MCRKPLNFFLLGFLLCALSPYIFALAEDSKQPLLVSADAVDLDQKKHLGFYLGHVTVDQGSTHIRADKAMTQGDMHTHFTQAIIEGSKDHQAHYWTLPSSDKPELHAYADTIIYYPKTHQIVLKGHAVVIQDQNKISASIMRYNSETQHVATFFDGEQTSISVQPNSSPSLEIHS